MPYRNWAGSSVLAPGSMLRRDLRRDGPAAGVPIGFRNSSCRTRITTDRTTSAAHT